MLQPFKNLKLLPSKKTKVSRTWILGKHIKHCETVKPEAPEQGNTIMAIMTRSTLLAVAASSLAVASAFMAPPIPALSLRSSSARSLSATSPIRRERQQARVATRMQVEQLAEHATLLAAYPEGLVNGMTAYFNLCTSHYL